MDHMQKSNIPQTRKQAGFTDDEVTASEQQYYSLDTSISIQKITDPIITSFITQAQAYESLMLGTLTQGFVGVSGDIITYGPRCSGKLLQSMTWMAMES